MIIAGFDEFHQVTTLRVKYLPKSDNSGQFDGKSKKKKINLFAISNSLPFPELNLFHIGFTKKSLQNFKFRAHIAVEIRNFELTAFSSADVQFFSGL